MTSATLEAPALPVGMPDHTQLPDEDPTAVHNDHEHPQSNLLTECLRPRLAELYPDGQFWVGADVGIYFTFTNPPLDGCRVPDWVHVPGVPPMLDGAYRRSYVLWNELVRPAAVIEYVSTDGREERDRTPHTGKFWIYERVIGAGYYVIFDPSRRTLEVFAQNGDGYHEVSPNEAGRFLVKSLTVELGIWDGTYRGLTTSWLRAWDPLTGVMVPHAEERASADRARAEAADRRAESAEMGLDESRSILTDQATELDARARRIEAAEKRADEQQKQTDAERRRADEQQKLADEKQKVIDEKQKQMDFFAMKLRELGFDPES